jgi:anti-anti-sigma regulatory factor
MSPTTELKVGRLNDGYVLKIQGRATIRESTAMQSFAKQALADGRGRLVVDLAHCESLDSTFQGCLLSLARRYGQASDRRFALGAPSAAARAALTASQLMHLLPIVEPAPTPIGAMADLCVEEVDSHALGEHILDCHRRLAEVDHAGGKFRRVIEQLERELQAGKSS